MVDFSNDIKAILSVRICSKVFSTSPDPKIILKRFLDAKLQESHLMKVRVKWEMAMQGSVTSIRVKRLA